MKLGWILKIYIKIYECEKLDEFISGFYIIIYSIYLTPYIKYVTTKVELCIREVVYI